MSDTLKTLCGICCCVVLVTFVILLATSFSSLEFNEWGLDYSGITKTVSKSSASGGIHFLGIGHHFIKFPKTVQTIEFSSENTATEASLNSRTSDGLEVTLEISFQYSLNADNLTQLYMTYGEEYKDVFVLVAMDILTDLATKYTAYNFFVDRQQIGAAMQDALNTAYKNICFASVDFFQLRSVDLPDKFEDAIQLTEVKKQDIQKAQAEKSKTEVEFETKKLEALYQMNVTQNLAEGDAQARLAQNNATVNSFTLVQETKAQAYNDLMSTLNFTNDQVINFIKTKVVRDHDASALQVNFDAIE